MVSAAASSSSTQTHSPPPQTVKSPAQVSRLKSSIRSSATSPDALTSLFISGLPHPSFLADRPIFSLSVHRLASAGRRELVASILSTSLPARPRASSSASSPSTPPPACPTTPSPLSAHLKPNVGTFNLRMAALCAKGRSFVAEELLDAMGAKGVLLPNRASFNTVIKGLCKEGEVGAAMALFKKMPEVPRQHGVSPNLETYITLLEALINKDASLVLCWRSARSACRISGRLRSKPWFRACSRAGRPRRFSCP